MKESTQMNIYPTEGSPAKANSKHCILSCSHIVINVVVVPIISLQGRGKGFDKLQNVIL